MNEHKLIQRLMLLDLNDLQRKTDKEFQLRRRLECATDEGVVKCASCGIYGHYKNFDGGHFIQRGHKGTRYMSANVWPQCKKCNHHLGGNYADYRERLVKKMGEEAVKRLESVRDVEVWKPMTYREWCIEIYLESKKIVKTLQGVKRA